MRAERSQTLYSDRLNSTLVFIIRDSTWYLVFFLEPLGGAVSSSPGSGSKHCNHFSNGPIGALMGLFHYFIVPPQRGQGTFEQCQENCYIRHFCFRYITAIGESIYAAGQWSAPPTLDVTVFQDCIVGMRIPKLSYCMLFCGYYQ